jgi:type I restriction enzyme S subunit
MAINNYKYQKPKKIDWLNAIPTHWEEVRLGSLFNQRKEKVSDLDYPPLSVTKNGVVPQLDNAAKSNDGDNRKLVLKGDFAINSRSDRKGSSGVSVYDGSVSLIYIVLKPIKIEPRYSEYLLKSFYFKEEYYRYGRGIVADLWTTRYSEMKNMIIPSAPIEEQTAIANFLDHKLEKIARFIKKKKQLVSLLTEQKVGVINQALTKGINPNAKLKPSNIEWLGGIPENWEVKRMKYLGEAIIGLTYSPTEMVDKGEGALVLRSSNVQNGKITYDDCVYVTTEIPDKKRTRKGDILICSRNGSIKLVGKNALIDEKASNESFGAFMTIFRSKNYEYLHYFFNSSSFKAQSGLFSTSTINQLTTGILNNIIISIPRTIDEQIEVINFIKSETEIIEKTISTIEKEIDLVLEYKKALIAEAVTGKIDVRDFKIPAIESPLKMVAEETAVYNKTS